MHKATAKRFAEIERQRVTWAESLLVLSWGRVEKLAALQGLGVPIPRSARDSANAALFDAVAVAEEWKVDVKTVLETATPIGGSR